MRPPEIRSRRNFDARGATQSIVEIIGGIEEKSAR
jgi:hypothetical protein